MINWRAIIKALTPPILLDGIRVLVRCGHSTEVAQPKVPAERSTDFLLSHAEASELVQRMDGDDFEFDAATTEKMLAAWIHDNSAVPYPTALTQAYAKGDAVAMNSRDVMEISYRLPYSLAYESTQQQKYKDFISIIERSGVVFSGATIVDVGAGLGGLLTVVGELHPDTRLVAIECANSALSYMARQRPQLFGRFGSLDADAESFVHQVDTKADIVLCTEVLEHLIHPDRALRNLLALKPARGLAISVPNGRSDTAAQHINFWSPESWANFVEQFADNWSVQILRCPSGGSPGGFDNVAVFRPLSPI